MLFLLPLFTFLLAFIRNGSANKKLRKLFEPKCDGKFNGSEITFIKPIELFKKVTVNIEINSENISNDDCFFEANLEFRHSLNSLKILKLSSYVFNRKTISTTKRIWVEFECWHFLVPGFYRISVPSASVNSFSEWTQINPPKLAVQIHLPAVAAIFPFCQNALSIGWTLPNCDKAVQLLDFRLRLLASLNEPSENEEMLYLEEFLLAVPNSEDTFLQKSFEGLHRRNVSTNFLRIPCSKFDIIHEHFCFELVSVSKQSQQHNQWDSKCIRTEAATAQRPNVGELWEWSEWTEWTKCFCRRNETNGTRKRIRYCRRSNTNLVERTTVRSFSMAQPKAAFVGRGGCRGGQIMQREKCGRRECQRSGAADNPWHFAASPLDIGQFFENSSTHGNGTFQCFCGCKLWEQPQGMFFAAFCPSENVQRWQLEFGRPFRVQIILTEKLAGEVPLAFELIRDNGEQKEAIWNSENNPHDQSATIEGFFEKAAIFELKSAISANSGDQKEKRKRTDFGILVEYKVIAFEEKGSGTPLKMVKIFCSKGPKFAHCSALLALFSLLFVLSAVFMPPIVFVFVVKRHGKKRLAKDFGRTSHGNVRDSCTLLVSTHCHNQIDSELIRSDGTDSTKLSTSLLTSAKAPTEAHQMIHGKGAVEQRSIGIQLSRLSTPRCASRQIRPHRRHRSSNCNGHRTSADNSSGSIGSVANEIDSNLADDFWNEDDDFGAEQLQLGGQRTIELENWPSHLVSDIDIDEIVRHETTKNNWNWPNPTLLDRRDVSTQHNLQLQFESNKN